jgi:hypothetical protein
MISPEKKTMGASSEPQVPEEKEENRSLATVAYFTRMSTK